LERQYHLKNNALHWSDPVIPKHTVLGIIALQLFTRVAGGFEERGE
jgi:hypothetical protein